METCDEQPNHVFIVQDRHRGPVPVRHLHNVRPGSPHQVQIRLALAPAFRPPAVSGRIGPEGHPDRHPLGQNHRDHAKFKRNLQVRSAAKRRQVHAAPPEARRCAKRYPRFAL